MSEKLNMVSREKIVKTRAISNELREMRIRKRMKRHEHFINSFTRRETECLGLPESARLQEVSIVCRQAITDAWERYRSEAGMILR